MTDKDVSLDPVLNLVGSERVQVTWKDFLKISKKKLLKEKNGLQDKKRADENRELEKSVNNYCEAVRQETRRYSSCEVHDFSDRIGKIHKKYLCKRIEHY